MREVAAVAGVSLSTVSRVVNGGDGVRDDLVGRRCASAVELLGYRHNLTASTLRRADGQSATHRADLRGRLEPVLRGGPPRGGGRRPGARGAAAGRLVRRGARARARARRGVRRARHRRPDRRLGGRRQLVPAARARGRGWRWCSSTGRRASSTPTPSSPTTPAARARRSSTCSRRGIAGSASSATGRTSSPLRSGCAGTSETLERHGSREDLELGPPSAVPRGRRV